MIKTKEVKGEHKKILVISDIHFPVEHRDTLDFLYDLKQKWKPDLCVQIGDIVDLHNFSRYKKEPSFISPADEIKKGMEKIQSMQQVFPDLIMVMGNHDVRIKDRAKEVGIPDTCLKDFRDIYEIHSKGWSFCDVLRLNWKDERKRVLMIHGKSKKPLKIATTEGCNYVQGHFHENPCVEYEANSHKLLWAMNVGCLVDRKHICFGYSNINLRKFILGVGLIENNMPKYSPMLLNDKGRWTGDLFL